MNARRYWWAIVLSATVTAMAGCSQAARLSTLEIALTNRLSATELVIGSRLGKWTQRLGEPSVIEQMDKGNTFFYWPAGGVAVFCHPLYHKQYEHKQRKEWVVTSILVPFTNTVHPRIPPVEAESRITFRKLIFDPIEAAKQQWESLPKVKSHRVNGILESLEIEKPDSLLGDYD